VGVIETSAALGACLLVLVVAIALGGRPYRPGKRKYIPMMIVALAASLGSGMSMSQAYRTAEVDPQRSFLATPAAGRVGRKRMASSC
jgi:hypothetical protein